MVAKQTITEIDRRKVLCFDYLNGADTPQKLHDITKNMSTKFEELS